MFCSSVSSYNYLHTISPANVLGKQLCRCSIIPYAAAILHSLLKRFYNFSTFTNVYPEPECLPLILLHFWRSSVKGVCHCRYNLQISHKQLKLFTFVLMPMEAAACFFISHLFSFYSFLPSFFMEDASGCFVSVINMKRDETRQ